MNRFDLLDGCKLLVLEYIFKLNGTEMEATCFDEIGENIGDISEIRSILLNRKFCEVSSNI